jgi:hypothetical protein
MTYLDELGRGLKAVGIQGRLRNRAAAVKSSAPGEAGDVFDDLPLDLPRRPWVLLAATAAAADSATRMYAGTLRAQGKRLALRRRSAEASSP